MRATLLACLLAWLLSPAWAGEPEGKDKAPVAPIVGPLTPFSDMMLDVQRLQARMATGDKDAYTEQRANMRAIGAAIGAAGPEAFAVKAERDAVIVYLLSGGQPRDVVKIAARGDFPATERDLLIGAAGYTAGRPAVAEKLLAFDVDAQSLRLGAQLAYAQSVLLTPKDPLKALDLLDRARLIAPGTLVEEAALRREIMLVGDLHKPERVAFLARQYVERFGKSIYAGDFVHALAATAVRFDLCATLGDFAKFSALLELAPPEQARAFLLTVARASVLLGRFDVAEQAALGASKTVEPGSPDETRARLYALLSAFPTLADGQAASALAGLPTGKLSAADRDLLSAAAWTQERLYELPSREAYADVWRELSVAAGRSPNLPESDDAPTATIRRALAALAASEALGDKEAAP